MSPDHLARHLPQPGRRQGLRDLLQRLLRQGRLRQLLLQPPRGRQARLLHPQEQRHRLVHGHPRASSTTRPWRSWSVWPRREGVSRAGAAAWRRARPGPGGARARRDAPRSTTCSSARAATCADGSGKPGAVPDLADARALPRRTRRSRVPGAGARAAPSRRCRTRTSPRSSTGCSAASDPQRLPRPSSPTPPKRSRPCAVPPWPMSPRPVPASSHG